MKLTTAQAAYRVGEKAKELARTTNLDHQAKEPLTERQIRKRLTLVRGARRHLNEVDHDLQQLLKELK